ncbi:hypothetical protein LCGC14_1128680 [marine sediment metagenome]|uniref:Uncharacterized protein n=1 Tax=marine sediment metagenome TaxID=412755 RepID=A0A0F9MPK9_9ZZZZ
MVDETKEAPSVAELEGKIARLANQVETDAKLAVQAEDAFAKAVKSGDVDKALELADARQTAKAVVAKSEAQHKSATRAIESAKYALNADAIAAIHNDVRDGKVSIPDAFVKLEVYGVTRLVVERSEETGKLLVNTSGPKAPKRSGGGGGGGNGRGQPVTVDGEEFASASAALHRFFPDSGPLNRDSILSKITNAGHEVS